MGTSTLQKLALLGILGTMRRVQIFKAVASGSLPSNWLHEDVVMVKLSRTDDRSLQLLPEMFCFFRFSDAVVVALFSLTVEFIIVIVVAM
ncbi:hypothetical protein SAY87_022222 [Trapa incisa]|uniref:Uncharacterized protein n=1 Tax=Trapa incisa TaxID=236973 RepID=A0AAN7PT93_9MYRT|nr:hypothetical protein SAY87_022222 [Trapa incisa]